jgi:nicotinamide mononucleotide transporter
MSIPYLPATERWAFFRNDFFIAGLLAVTLTALSYVIGVSVGWLSAEVNWFEVGATVLNYASFYLSVKRRRVFYLVGFAASALFIVTYLQANLLASAGLSAYLTIALFVGFYMWGKDSSPKLKIEHVQWKWIPVYLLVTAAAYFGAVVLVTALGGSFAFWDGAILVFTLLAQFMLDRKKLENWWIWIIGVNGAGTILYFTSGLYFVAIQQLIFGIASVWGWWEWNRSYRLNKFALDFKTGKLTTQARHAQRPDWKARQESARNLVSKMNALR